MHVVLLPEFFKYNFYQTVFVRFIIQREGIFVFLFLGCTNNLVYFGVDLLVLCLGRFCLPATRPEAGINITGCLKL